MEQTIAEIAAALNVSITTVRLVVGGRADKYRISAATQKRIRDHIAQHGCRLNHAARSLKVKYSDAIGLVIPDITNAFFAEMMTELEQHCRENGLVLLTVSTKEDPEQEHRALQMMLSRGIDGLIVASAGPPAYENFLDSRLRQKLVLIDRAYQNENYPVVVSDNYQGGYDLTATVLKATGGPFPFLCAKPTLPSIAERMRGYRTALADAAAPQSAVQFYKTQTDDIPSGRLLAQQMLATGETPKGFICSSLLILEGVLQEIKARKGVVPQDVIIGTFDDHPLLHFLPNAVFSVEQNIKTLAQNAFDLLVACMRGNPHTVDASPVPVRLIRHD